MDKTHVKALQDLLGPESVRTDEESLRGRSHDYWVVSHLRDWRGEKLPLPGAVAMPGSTGDVQRLLRYANERKLKVVPFGLGSGVCGGVIGDPAMLIVDMSRMNAVRGIDDVNLLGTFDAGKNGLEAEEAVAAKGLTIGHWPQSIALSSVGGWVSTRASGQFSTAYGNIEDIVYSIEAVLPDGTLVTLGKAPRAAAGPDLRHVLMGAEGTMGIVTGVTFSLRRAPEARSFTAFYADTMDRGFEAQRRIVQADWRPPVMRQYDHSEVARNFADHKHDEDALLIMVHEGPRARVDAEVSAVTAIATEAGLEPAPEASVSLWMERRNHVPNWRDLFERSVVADTIEISGTWTQIEKIYRDAVASLSDVPGVVNASAHSSHVYRSGINLYFTFAAIHENSADMEPTYFECWRRVIEATAQNGGGIAHHHGAGRLRKAYLHHDLGEEGVRLLRSLKNAVDPNGIMNPGNLIPDA
jgi:alkyldihydroxyacetonephosphate synthase